MTYLDPLEAARVFAGTAWVKSSFSTEKSDNCLEWNATEELVGIRDNNQPNGPVIVVDRSQWTALQAAAIKGSAS